MTDLDQLGEEESFLWFYSEGYYDIKSQQEEGLFLVTMPYFVDNEKNLKLTERMKELAYEGKYQENTPYYRVTEEQWNRLTKAFFELREQASAKIEDVTYTYDELFTLFTM